jgi:hypothetical protein
MFDIVDELTSIEAAPDAVPQLDGIQPTDWLPGYPATLKRESTGARVTIGFRRPAPLPPGCEVSLYYDMAGDGTHRQMHGTPQLTHTLARPGDSAWYHYRLSQWIPAQAVMHVINSLPTDTAYVRLRTDLLGITTHSDSSGGASAALAIHRHQVES